MRIKSTCAGNIPFTYSFLLLVRLSDPNFLHYISFGAVI